MRHYICCIIYENCEFLLSINILRKSLYYKNTKGLIIKRLLSFFSWYSLQKPIRSQIEFYLTHKNGEEPKNNVRKTKGPKRRFKNWYSRIGIKR